MNSNNKNYTKGVLFTLLGGICWGLSGTISQYMCSIQNVNPKFITCCRLLGAGVILMMVAFWQDRENVKRFFHTPGDVLHGICFGIGGLSFTQFAYLISVTKTNSGTATVLQYLSTILILLYTCLRFRKLPDKREIFGIICCLSGCFLLATHGSLTTLAISEEGLFWGLLSAVAVCFYMLIPQRLMGIWGSILTVGFGMLSGGIAFFLIMRIWTIPVSLNPQAGMMLFYIVVIGTVVAFTSYLHGSHIVGAARGSMLGCMEPLVAMLTSAAFLGTVYTGIDLVGTALVLGTVFILSQE